MSLLVEVQSKKEEKFLSRLLKKLGFKSHILTKKNQENVALYLAMHETKRDRVYQLKDAVVEYQRQKNKRK